MEYIYESIQNGVVNLTIPNTGKSVKLLRGGQVKLDQPLTGGYLRVLKLVSVKEDTAPAVSEIPPVKAVAKVEDKITQVLETPQTNTDSVQVNVSDTKPTVEVVEVPKNTETVSGTEKKSNVKKKI